MSPTPDEERELRERLHESLGPLRKIGGALALIAVALAGLLVLYMLKLMFSVWR